MITSLQALLALSTMDSKIRELSRDAQAILRVQLNAVQSNAAGSSAQTLLTAEAKEVYKGALPAGSEETVSILVPGVGSNGASSFKVLGFPKLKVGREYIVFVNWDASGHAELVAWTAYRVVQLESGVRAVVKVGEPGMVRGSSQKSSPTSMMHARATEARIQDYDSFVSEIYRGLD